MLDWAMARPAFKTQLFRFVDVFPALDRRRRGGSATSTSTSTASTCRRPSTSASTSPDHVPFGRPDRGPGRPAQHPPHGRAVHRGGHAATRRSTASTPLWREGSAFTVDLLGEKTVVAAEADRYAGAGDRPADRTVRRERGLGPRRPPRARRPRPAARGSTSASSRPRWPRTTSRSPARRARGRPGTAAPDPPAAHATRGAFVHFDMEHYDVKDLTLSLFRDLLSEDEFADLRRRHRDPGLPARQPRRPGRPHRVVGTPSAVPITVRLVKGAYWDTETVHARAAGLAGAGVRGQGRDRRQLRALRPAAARPPRRGARPRSAATTSARSPTPSPTHVTRASPTRATRSRCSTAWPSRCTRPSAASACACGCTPRSASWCPGMAYLVRRLLENTSNESLRAPPLRRGRAPRRAAGRARGRPAAGGDPTGRAPRHRPRRPVRLPSRAGARVAAGLGPRRVRRRRWRRSTPSSVRRRAGR